MIKINETRKTNSISMLNSIFDVHRKIEKQITIFGIVIWRRNFVHHMDYKLADSNAKSIGFTKPDKDEKEK